MQEKVKIQSHKDLIVWQKSFALVKQVYLLCKLLPDSENYGLKSQMQRSALSIPSNIAEGFGRHSKKYFKHFPLIAYGSACELETQLLLAHDVYGLDQAQAIAQLEERFKMLRVLIKKLD